MNRKLWILLVTACWVATPALVHATGQAPDVIELNGKEFALHTYPLEPYLQLHPDKKPQTTVMDTSLWRGYVAHWQIVKRKLVLKGVDIQTDGRGAMKDVTRQVVSDSPTVAAWYSGALVVPRGKIVSYAHMGYASIYESYSILTVKNGVVIRREELSQQDFESYRTRKFQEFRKTALYAEEFKKAVEELKDSELTDGYLRDFYTEKYLSVPDFPK